MGNGVTNFVNGTLTFTNTQMVSFYNSNTNRYTVIIPKEIFPTIVETNNGSESVEKYKIDITAAKRSNNAAITILFSRN